MLKERRGWSFALNLRFLLAVAFLFASGCTMNQGAEKDKETAPPLQENNSLGPLPVIDPGLVDTIISGDPQAAAEALLEVTLEERSALACVELLLPRLAECGEKMDDAVLTREAGQPVWMRLYGSGKFSTNKQTRKHQILLRLADCIREASPSVERAQARRHLFQVLAPEFFADQYCVAIARRAVVFASPSAVRSETGWDDLLGLISPFITSNKLDLNQRSDICDVYLAYCRQYPAEEARIVGQYGHAFGKSFAEFLEATKTANFVQPYFSERNYRALRDKTIPELASIYAGKDYRDARGLIAGLLTGTRQARAESFPLVKPYLETYRESRKSYFQWVPLLQKFCVPVAESAENEEIERQQWIMEELIGQIERGERGDPKSGADPICLLRFLVVTVAEADKDPEERTVQQPYGKDRIVEVLLDQTLSTTIGAAASARRELDVLCKFDESTARSIEQGLVARKKSISNQ